MTPHDTSKTAEIAVLDEKTSWLKEDLNDIKKLVRDLDTRIDQQVNSCGNRFAKLEVNHAVSKTKIGLMVTGISVLVSGFVAWLIRNISS